MIPSLPAEPTHAPREAALRAAAERLEAGFIRQMLQDAGLGRAGGLGGGPGGGGEQWTSFLLDAQADAIARSGGLGLAQSLFEALSRTERGSGQGPAEGQSHAP